MFFFQLPWLPERLARATSSPASAARSRTPPGRVHEEDLRRYEEAWAQPGAPTAMINYYRAAFRDPPWKAESRIGPLEAPTRVIWGERDWALGAELAEPERRDVPNLERVVRLPEATHWVQHDEPERVNELLIEFFRDGS